MNGLLINKNLGFEDLDFKIENLGECKQDNPLIDFYANEGHIHFADEINKIRFNIYKNEDICDKFENIFLEKAGPRSKIYFIPEHVKAAITTCGGLCPGFNDVIRSIVRTLWKLYGVRNIFGFKLGYKGLLPNANLNFVELNPDIVDDINQFGGTILGSSRGGIKPIEIVDTLERMGINMLFNIGGDGTQKGSVLIAEEIERRNLKIAVVGIPKTIDNDFMFVQKSFGFETAVEQAVAAVAGAHFEANSAYNGIGLVKVMGRDSGFIAAYTALSSNDVNFCLIPELDFDIEGPNGFLAHLERRLLSKGNLDEIPHAVILIAEGAGQKYFDFNNRQRDDSGNLLYEDIGLYIKAKIKAYFESKNIPITLKYIDPSYIIRSSPANASDSLYCARLGSNAVHAAMAGKTKLLISLWSTKFVHIPIKMAVIARNKVNINGSFWRDVLASTGQPFSMKN
ncbi:ATP-dependent 6-phosphofructokinase [Borrelia miyamotoi]|uniref:ATP-dependent 6-phosphofructokinase n=1 Tax=Borrelia miyamotoi TaxID=47466 RepID=A0AAQ2WVX0_9SPIR|nr:ATP-dependent 6-phosphofructokinase [Borrelia miyamotoi]AGT27671.1 diphosphate--fructose-6-phosphate 1-phosphotransferase [Borrelia miyamotoi LB-2001]AOW95915.1 diphosphate--fructose-6-phosphate 1-phosphotransferase [Borrelia miyamotoi]QTL83806.1 ATP-dependent 6-phosphofructokinase [Borrelia miyamotoi]WAZ84887.1 ATP-dependent 6-phosphofructokinase [Borrelia miyamotoi]WAZ90670.1 ATP-dependent 6-phosphofructokinase [Borrelia miyamotoi]